MAERKFFDLNIKRILTTWQVPHACRELVANALDEHVLCGLKPKDVNIKLDNGRLTIRDRGRGITKFHFVQDESVEKVKNFKNSQIIGHFGIGMKDAVAVLARKEKVLEIKCKHGRYTFEYKNKYGHDDITTLHVIIHDDVPSDFVGTEITVHPIREDELNKTKALFLRFSNRTVLFTCRHGEVLTNEGETSSIYVKGLRIDENQQYQFSYNIYEPNKSLREKMSRDKNSISMGVYSSIVKNILTSTTKRDPLYQMIEKMILEKTVTDLKTDVGYKDITVHFTKNMETKVIVTQEQFRTHPGVFDEIKDKAQIVSQQQYRMIAESGDRKCKTIDDIMKIGTQYDDVITYDDMSEEEKATFDMGNEAIRSNPDIFGSFSLPKIVRNLTLRGLKVSGVHSKGDISIDYHQLQQGGYTYFGTLAHEHAHKKSGAADCTKSFEQCLTQMLGKCIDLLCVTDQSPSPKRRKIATSEVRSHEDTTSCALM
jgi:hypothetical protein